MKKIKEKKFVINKNMTFAELIEKKPELVERLQNMGLGCGGCHFAFADTIESGAMIHGMDVDEVMAGLRK